MDKKRREFLKIAGISTLAGLGGQAVVTRLVTGDTPVNARADEHESTGREHDDSHGAEAAGHGAEHAEKPTGKRYGMVIDMRAFRAHPGLAAKCVKACHREHNVPNFPNKKDEVKWIWLTEYEKAFTEHSNYYRSKVIEEDQFPVLCNHCDKPPCVRACPTKATFKNKDGIIMMDFHRCIGCRFCMAACPYGSRSFNWRDPRPFINKADLNPHFPTRMRGVVEKCNFCADRLAIGKKPACVEACGDTEALVFGDLNDPNSQIRKLLHTVNTLQRKPAMGTLPSVFYIV